MRRILFTIRRIVHQLLIQEMAIAVTLSENLDWLDWGFLA